jgi:putative ABC transport system substrate-binding protein
MKRRELIALLGGAATWPLTVGAQQVAIPTIGVLGSATPTQWAPFVDAYMRGLGETGFADGRNVAVQYRWAEGKFDRLPDLAADLVRSQVTVMAALTTPAAVAARRTNSTIPTVFVTVSDPVKIGLVPSLSRPGGNFTGATYLHVEGGPKLLELLHEMVPGAKTAAALINPMNPNVETVSSALRAAASTRGLRLDILNISNDQDIETAFASLAERRPDGLVVVTDAFISTRGEQLAALALRHRLPSLFQYRSIAAAGGLISYGGNASEAYRQAGLYTGRILKGEKPADLPVQQTTKFELAVNVKTAKALGLTVPPSLLARADEVIE